MRDTGIPIDASGYDNLGDFDECPCGCGDTYPEWGAAHHIVLVRLTVDLTPPEWYDTINPCVLEALDCLAEAIETSCGVESKGVAGPNLAKGYRLGMVLLGTEPSVGSLDVDCLTDFGVSCDMDKCQSYGMPEAWGGAVCEVLCHTTSADDTPQAISSPVENATLFGLESGAAVAWAEFVLLEEGWSAV